ncbi:MAG: DNA polymerase ligase N-terminal domain-containing protein [Streptosporangiales bacterium]
MAKRLSEYERKRDFEQTKEPRTGAEQERADEELRFVIQQHHATSMHYDFRLEVDGALKSWAVPKGPSTDPEERRLAQATEDHPLEYADFEGYIPKGEYGGGPVIVWDTGTYRNITQRRGEPMSMEDGLERGHVSVWLEGEKLRGGWSLNRMRSGDREAWLLIKRDDETADRRRKPVRTQPESVRSGRKVDEVEPADGG